MTGQGTIATGGSTDRAAPALPAAAPSRVAGWRVVLDEAARKAVRLATALANLPVSWISRCLPKDEDLWVFGAWGGRAFADNSRYLFEWMREHHPEVRVVWMARDRALRRRLREGGVPCCSMYGLSGYLLAARAGVALLSNSRTGDVNRFAVAGRTRVVQLWHGTPIKKIGSDDTVFSNDRNSVAKRAQAWLNRLSALVFPAQREEFDLLTVMSEAAVEPFLTAFRIERSRVAVTGIARTDRLLAARDESRSGPRRILYLPTFRGAADSCWDALPAFEPERVDAFLAERDAELCLKLHPANVPGDGTLRRIAACGRLRLMPPGDIHEHLPGCDVLLTDYSSIFVDFLLLDRPIVFFPFDRERYLKRDRELYYDYDRVTPGPKARTWHDVLVELDRALADPSDGAAERARVRGFFYDRIDGRSCERIHDAVRARLKTAR